MSMFQRLPLHPRRIGRMHRLGAWTLDRARIGNPIRALYGINAVLPDDIYIVSYPRSGNTWIRHILAYLTLGTGEHLDSMVVARVAPDAYRDRDIINGQNSGRLIKIHEPFLRSCPRVIYVYRDYRAAAVSYWHFIRRTEAYRGTFSEFLRSMIPRRHGSWSWHMTALKQRLAVEPATIHVIRYEDLLSAFASTVAALSDWCRIGRDVDLAAVERLTRLEAMVLGDQQHNGPFRKASGESFFVDHGKGARWRCCWSEEDLDWLSRDRSLLALMNEFGYL